MLVEALFLYGTLRHLPLLEVVAGVTLSVEPAWLPDHTVTHAVAHDGQVRDFPLFTARKGETAQGYLIRPGSEARERLDAYERVFGYDTTEIAVETAQGTAKATIYVPRADLWRPGAPWSLADWVAGPGVLAPEVAAEVMTLLPSTPPALILERIPMVQIRVASRRRARSEPAPATLRRAPTEQDVEVISARRPYARYFGVEEADLRFRHFDGSFSRPVTRAGFIMGDAVTVLPYDPVRDTVMLVEQFRFGPYARGDANPWSLEPIAGRIDPFEDPETAARRETQEEARLTLRAMHRVGRYFVSPGAVTEYLLSYVGLADLPDSAEGVHGLDSEAEDIRSHVISFARLMDLVESGEVANAPLLISAQWLAMNRDRLRGSG